MFKQAWRMKKLLVMAFLWAVVCRGADHPRLIFTDARVAKLKGDPATVSNAAALAEAGALDAQCLAYRVTGERKYADKVRELIMKDCRPPKEGEAAQPWPWGLGGAHKCYDVALGYDSIYDALTGEERATIRTALLERGIEPFLGEWVLGGTRTTALDAMGHNFWASCVALPGVAVLAIMDEEPRAKAWLEKVVQATDAWFTYPGSLLDHKPANFDDGAFYESVNYMNYSLSMVLTFRLAWENAMGAKLPPNPMLDRCSDFFIHACYPNNEKMLSVNFGDSGPHASGNLAVAMLWANGIRKPRDLWYLKLTDGAGTKEAMNSMSPMGLVYYPPAEELATAPAEPDLPHSVLYRENGWAMMRDAWTTNATMLAVKSGFTWNHAHSDAGSFILFHRGQNLLIDSGNCWYPHPQYDEYYRQSKAHSVVLFNGEGQPSEDPWLGSSLPGSVQHMVDAGGLKYVLADATGPTARHFSRNYRHFLWIGDVILVLDDLRAFDYGTFEWLLHVDGEAKRDGLDLKVQLGDAKVAVRPLFPERFAEGFVHDAPERMRLVEKMGLKDHQHTNPVPYYAMVPPGKAQQLKFITAILLDPDHPPMIERLESLDMQGVRIERDGVRTEVYLNLLSDGRRRHKNANLAVDGWETDANLLAVTSENGKPSRCFVAHGSYLRREGNILFDSFSKAFAVVQDGNVEIYP